VGNATESRHPVPEGVRFFKCRTCLESRYGDLIPKECPRCLAQTVQGLSRKQFIALIDAGDVRWCGACGVHHIR
jgi:hypothetical protein